jgi:hypothetical protein
MSISLAFLHCIVDLTALPRLTVSLDDKMPSEQSFHNDVNTSRAGWKTACYAAMDNSATKGSVTLRAARRCVLSGHTARGAADAVMKNEYSKETLTAKSIVFLAVMADDSEELLQVHLDHHQVHRFPGAGRS